MQLSILQLDLLPKLDYLELRFFLIPSKLVLHLPDTGLQFLQF